MVFIAAILHDDDKSRLAESRCRYFQVKQLYGSIMFKKYDRYQQNLLPPNPWELIPEDDLVHVVADSADLVDFSKIYRQYSSLGQNAYDPKMLLSLLVYSYTQSVFSARKIAERARYDIRFIYLTGNQRPDFRTIADFRKNHKQLLNYYFRQTLKICMAAGMVKLDRISIDGSKLKASASRKQMKDRAALNRELALLDQEIDRILAQADQVDRENSEGDDDNNSDSPMAGKLDQIKKRRAKLLAAKEQFDDDDKLKKVNLTDPDSRNMVNTACGYNAQIAVDCDSYLIVANDVVQDANDSQQLLPMIEAAESNTGSAGQPKEILADSGYSSSESYETLEPKKHLEVYVPTRQQVHRETNPAGPFDKSKFEIDLENETGVCPQGRPMVKKRSGTNKSGRPYVEFTGTYCLHCVRREECTSAKFRSVVVLKSDHLLRKMEAKMDSDQGLLAMLIRKMTVEPVIGILKEHLGFRKFNVRGLREVEHEFNLLCEAYNLKKLHKFLRGRRLKDRICLIFDYFLVLFRRTAEHRIFWAA